WDDTNLELFLKIWVEKVQIVNRPSTHFIKEGSKNIVSKFVVRTGVSYNYKKLKNKWDSLKKEFAIWAKLVEHQTGLKNPEYLKWRNEGQKFLDMMEICFKDVVATSYMSLVPYVDPSTENEVSNKNAYARINEVDIEIDNFDDDGDSPQQYNDATQEETSTTHDKKIQKTSHRERKRSINEKLQESFDRLISGI
ncbi:Myb/SANT-like domain-containing protein, partial [Dioscorea alata]